MIPKNYVPGWKKDMENRQLILEVGRSNYRLLHLYEALSAFL